MALETSADSPAPLRQVSTLIGQWVGRLGPVWVEAEVAQLTRRPGICFLVLRDLRATSKALRDVTEKIDEKGAGSLLSSQPLPDYKP